MSQCICLLNIRSIELATYSAPEVLGFSSESVHDIGVGGRHTGYVTESVTTLTGRTNRQTDRRTDGWTMDGQKSPNDCSNPRSAYALRRGLVIILLIKT